MSTPDARRPSEHDCDRILYSDAFRRLGGVTQVVAVGEMPLFHTRLTHTLKVQQLARRIGQHLSRDSTNKAILTVIGGIDVDAAEAAGLAHDMGHPPFGHVGEAVLDRMCRKFGLDGFEGNPQTLRILTKLSRRDKTVAFGLDLSDVTLRAVIKYPWLRTGAHSEDSKWNAYPSEAKTFSRVREGFDHQKQSVEAAIMDWADDITYAVHDLEDFVRAGRVPMATLATSAPELAAFTKRATPRVSKKFPDVEMDVVTANFTSVLQTAFGQLQLHRGTADEVAVLRGASSWLIGIYVSEATLVNDDMPLHVSDEIRAEVEFFKQLTWHYVINDPRLATMQEGQARLVGKLFKRLADWLDSAESEGELFRLPTRLVDLYDITKTEPGATAYQNKRSRQGRAVADYISSLTEGQAIDLYGRVTALGDHSVLDPWLAY